MMRYVAGLHVRFHVILVEKKREIYRTVVLVAMAGCIGSGTEKGDLGAIPGVWATVSDDGSFRPATPQPFNLISALVSLCFT